MKYLIDTDWCVYYLRGDEKISKKLNSFRKKGLAISIVTLVELYEGVYSSKNPRLAEQVLGNFLSGVIVLEIDVEICKIFGREKSKLKGTGRLIGDFDLLIASTCLYHGLTLLTNNKKHYQEIKSIEIPQDSSL